MPQPGLEPGPSDPESSTLTNGLLTPHKWNVRVNGMRSVLSFFVVLTVDQFVGHGGGLLERQKRDSHVYRKTGTLPLIFRKNQSYHYLNDEVWETVKKVWNSWRVMDAKMKTTSNYVNLGFYIISSAMYAFWLVLAYDLLEDRPIDDVIIKTFGVWWADLYQKEALRQLSDTSFYGKIYKDLTFINQNIVQSTLNDYVAKQELPATAKNLTIITPTTSCFYFLPKIHKPNNPGRPIISACSCPTQLISSYLDKVIVPIVKTLPSYIKDSQHALEIFRDFNLIFRLSPKQSCGKKMLLYSARGQQLRNCITVGIHLNLNKDTWKRIHQSQCSFCCVKV